jgi:ribonuclease R
MSPRIKVKGVTLDDTHTRDIDDAFWISTADDGLHVYVSIADVASGVIVGSSTDEFAHRMTATRYFATGNSPMLPRRLSEDELSLWPRTERQTLTVELTYGPDFQLKGSKLYRSKLVSEAKLAYSDIPGFLKDPAYVGYTLLTDASKLAFALLDQRRSQGAMVLYDLNNGWVMTEEGFLKQLEKHEDTIGYIIVQELMIAANRAVAAWCIERDIPILYRNHQAKKATPDRAELMAQIKGAFETPLANLDFIRQQAHMFLEKAEYSPILRGHFGLNVPAYTHFTSPIRRYADLVNHRQIRAHLKDAPLPYSQEKLEALAKHINEVNLAERQATTEWMKENAEKRARTVALDARRIEGLGAKDFERVVKVEARSGQDPSPSFVEAFKQRILGNRVPTICLTAILAEAPKTPPWTDLRKDVLDYLGRHLCDVTSVLTQAAAGYKWPGVIYTNESTGPSHAPVFKATAAFDDGNSSATSDEVKTRKEAEQLAALALLAERFGLLMPAVAWASKTVPQVAQVAKKRGFDFTQQKDPVALIQEYCQAAGLPPPEYVYVQSGPSHIPEITCTVKLNGMVETAKATSKKEAKKIAVASLIGSLQK